MFRSIQYSQRGTHPDRSRYSFRYTASVWRRPDSPPHQTDEFLGNRDASYPRKNSTRENEAFASDPGSSGPYVEVIEDEDDEEKEGKEKDDGSESSGRELDATSDARSPHSRRSGKKLASKTIEKAPSHAFGDFYRGHSHQQQQQPPRSRHIQQHQGLEHRGRNGDKTGDHNDDDDGDDDMGPEDPASRVSDRRGGGGVTRYHYVPQEERRGRTRRRGDRWGPTMVSQGTGLDGTGVHRYHTRLVTPFD